MADIRTTKLKRHFDSVIYGRTPLSRSNSALFIEAICAQPNPPTCINAIVGSTHGVDRIQTAMRFDLSISFLNGPATNLITYLSSSDIAAIDSGSLLSKILLAIVEPPLFFMPFVDAFKKGILEEKAQLAFGWLLLQLISYSGDGASSHREIAQDSTILGLLLSSSHHELRSIAHKIEHIVNTLSVGSYDNEEYTPGGRHDNDFADFRAIDILPTADELISKEKPFLRPSSMLEDPETMDTRVPTHLDNQFRLLREDMLYEIREELQVVLGLKTGKFRGLIVDGLSVQDVYFGSTIDRRCKWSLTFKCKHDLYWFKKVKPDAKDRKAHLVNHKSIFRHQSNACLIIDQEIVAFPAVHRDEDLLAQNPPVFVLQFDGEKSTTKTLLRLKAAKNIQALQEKQSLPLSEELLCWSQGSLMHSLSSQSSHMIRIIDAIESNPTQDLQSLLQTPKPISLDRAQISALLAGLKQRVSLIQGPPGTGKSFIGALLAKALHDSTSSIMLVVCYTNHALDQFLEDLLGIDIPASSIVRLGGKTTPLTDPLTLQKQTRIHKLGKADWREIDALKDRCTTLCDRMEQAFQSYKQAGFNTMDLLEFLEFEDPEYFEAFRVPVSADGMQTIGKKGRAVTPNYLLRRWINGQNAGMFINHRHIQDFSQVWKLSVDRRRSQLSHWREGMLKDRVDLIYTIAREYNQCLANLDRTFGESDAAVLRSKRIIACTTTAAAKYREIIDTAHPDVLLVEEAGEILESHILTALGKRTTQLILIGDHKQLRPKVNSYLLTVEKGEGLDLNRSLFERLVLKGYPHDTLSVQHRMRPEISDLVRQLTYPELQDAPKTKNRPDLRGLRDNIVFINHDKPEDDIAEMEAHREMSAVSSKQNKFEVDMVLKILRYLGQQGYGTDKLVVLTPYLGQLRELQRAISQDNDPVLSDMDSHDLVRAGLISPSAANIVKRPIRLATIDNYQGEESDIVIISLTRSNPENNIGFMFSHERLTVMLSRARNALIMIGNAHTFMHARKGGDLWTKLFGLLRNKGHIYDGLPVRCERHQNRTALLTCTDDFDKECPDGGCLEPCGTILNCGLHNCLSKCHQLSDHSKMACEHIMYTNCSKKHKQQYKCHKGPPLSCTKCDDDKRAADKKMRAQFALQEKRDAEQRAHARQLAELEDEISRERLAVQEAREAEDRKRIIIQKEKDLRDIKTFAAGKASSGSPDTPSPGLPSDAPVSSLSRKAQRAETQSKKSDHVQLPVRAASDRPPDKPVISASEELWARQKTIEGASNDAIDAIMAMTGLEDVKKQVLAIKDKVDLYKRQNDSIAERFNVAMLGNPGTGKTTVARHYAKFLTSVGVLRGDTFIETTGSRLANDGVPALKKQLEELVNAGGGAVFIDEAYQLTTSSFQGGQILDFLLAEIENLVGKVVFIFAGYDKEMEKFYEHNPGLPSRVPYTLHFKDYDDAELLTMMERTLMKRSEGKMQVEGGLRGLYCRIAVRRLGRRRGTPGFGNARALDIMFANIRERQAERVGRQRRDGQLPDDFLLTKEDMIGPDPSQVMVESAAWKKLQSMIGLGAVKKSVLSFFTMIESNYGRELLEQKPLQVSLNRVFIGSPGTGKTTVAKLYGNILVELGLLSNGEVVVKNPADFIGSHLGESESKTKAILANTVGKVLVIDEAYMLYGGTNGANDPYKTAVIDTIVAEVQSVPGEDRCVLLLGYKTQMEEMFQNVNPGLSRRFSIENSFQFDDYNDEELLQALNLKLEDQDLSATDAAKAVAIEVLSRARNRPNFGNIGEVENLLSQAKMRYQTRQTSLPIKQQSPNKPFEPQDFDPEFNRNENAATNLVKLFEDVIGCEEIVNKMTKYQQMAKLLKAKGMEIRDHIPTSFIFKGPPGTGKTTTARKMGKVYYDMGFLSSTEVVECSASDLIGEYVGQTGPKTRKLLEKALGRVLFIDEAYRLSEGHFAQEAIDELVGLLTQDTFRGKLLIILAGYTQEMNALMSVNTGLSSRFPDEIIFRNLDAVHCLKILQHKLRKQNICLATLDDPSSVEYVRMAKLIDELSQLPSWGNARDVETLAKKLVFHAFTSPLMDASLKAPDQPIELNAIDATACIEDMLLERQARASNIPAHAMSHNLPEKQMFNQPPPQSAVSTKYSTAEAPTPPEVEENVKPQHAVSDGRDAGVSDAVWRQLQIDKKAEEDAANCVAEQIALLAEQEQAAREALQILQNLKAAQAKARNDAERNRLKAKLEAQRLRELKQREESARRAAALEAARQEEVKRRHEEARVQEKIREMGMCEAGFRWIKQADGYRCAGGSHFLSNGQLGI